jgi:hypothetical protein
LEIGDWRLYVFIYLLQNQGVINQLLNQAYPLGILSSSSSAENIPPFKIKVALFLKQRTPVD